MNDAAVQANKTIKYTKSRISPGLYAVYRELHARCYAQDLLAA